MSTITTRDGTTIFYKDWGRGQPIVFHHGWPLSADDWDAQLLFFLQRGYRVIAVSRFGYLRTPLPADATPAAQADAHACLLDALKIARAAIVGAWILAALVVIGTVAALFSTGGSFLALFEAMGILIMVGAPANIVMSSWRLALSKATELAHLAELQHEEWRRRYLARWLAPA